MMYYLSIIKATALVAAGVGVGMVTESVANVAGRAVSKAKKVIRKAKKRSGNVQGQKYIDCCATLDAKETIATPDKSEVECEEISKLKERLAIAQRDYETLTQEYERLQLKHEESITKPEIVFPQLVRSLNRMYDRPGIKEILEGLGLSLYEDYTYFKDGFMRIKNESVTTATLVCPALVRGDQLVEPGIVHVPMSEPGAEPQRTHFDNEKFKDAVLPESLATDGKTDASEETKNTDFQDDFVMG